MLNEGLRVELLSAVSSEATWRSRQDSHTWRTGMPFVLSHSMLQEGG